MSAAIPPSSGGGSRRLRWAPLAFLPVLLGVAVRGAAVPEAEALQAPTRARLANVQAAARRDGWLPQGAGLKAAALLAYEKERLAAAEAWLDVYRWAALLGRSEVDYVPRWVEAVNAAKVGHRNLQVPRELRPRPLGAAVSAELQAWVLGNPAFSAEFFALLSPVDYLPRVLAILDELHRADPVRFRGFASLALAIAVVYDAAPPPVWPHGQVREETLPRRLPEPAAAFTWWIQQDQRGRTYHKLGRLSAEELKFVVDTPAPWQELEWAQTAVDQPLGQLAQVYAMVRYRQDRVVNHTPVWPGRTYRLPDILGMGGICADQAYFATQVGKARGVPTLLFYGAGNDGRHAWFGYLGPGQKWHLDAGRYAEQRLVTGHARDPQTWGVFSDHELKFLSERFRALPSFRQSRTHANFAAEYLAAGQARAAGAAARKAVSFEKRNLAAWDTLILAARQEGRDARTVESLLREAALAFARYPDLEVHYVNRVVESLRARGESSAADEELRRLVLKNRSGRGDLAVQQAKDSLRRAMETLPIAEQIRTYHRAVDTCGREGGMAFFDEIVVGFAEHLVQLRQPAEARRAVERARQALQPEPGSQLALEFERLLGLVRDTK